VLVALAIVAFGMTAVLAAMTSAADNAYYMRDKTLAAWVAQNQISIVRLKGQMPKKGKTNGEVEEFAGRNWVWEQEVLPLQTKGMWRIDVSVRPLKDGESKTAALSKKASWYVTETGVMGDAIDPNANDPAKWFPQPELDGGNDNHDPGGDDHDAGGDHDSGGEH
jgi:general secretion pathway protein I